MMASTRSCFTLSRNVIRQRVGVSLFFMRITEYTRAIETGLLHELHHFSKVAFRFSGMSGNERCTNGDARYFAADGSKQVPVSRG